jgi:uncharacterized protein (DUF2267 family)
MTVPSEYLRATDHFSAFLLDARDMAGLGSTHQAYTMVQGVLQTFRRRLEIREAILFAGVLPPVLRALFVADWNPEEPRRPFEDRSVMTREVQALRADHVVVPRPCCLPANPSRMLDFSCDIALSSPHW